jgi:HEAT repeat protein
MRVAQTQPVTDETPAFVTPIDIVVTTDSGSRVHTVTVDEASEVFDIAVDGPPFSVGFDPEGYVPKTLVYPRSRQELTFVLGRGKTALERSDAAEGLAVFPRDEDVAAVLARAATTDSNHSVRQAASTSLGTVGGDNALKSLLSVAASDKEASVRKASVIALASYPASRIEGPLLELYRRDQSYGVQGAVLDTLVRARSDRGISLARETALSRSANESLRKAALEAYAEVGDKTVLDVALQNAKVGVPFSVRAAAIKLVGKHGKNNAAAYEVLERQARTEGYDMRSPAIEGLGEIGDRQALDTLRAVAGDDRLDGRLRARARESIRKITSPATK